MKFEKDTPVTFQASSQRICSERPTEKTLFFLRTSNTLKDLMSHLTLDSRVWFKILLLTNANSRRHSSVL